MQIAIILNSVMEPELVKRLIFILIFFLKGTTLHRSETDSLFTSYVCSIIAHGNLSYWCHIADVFQ